MRTKNRWMAGWLALALAAGACSSHDVVGVGGNGPAAPRALDARYYAGAVYLTWELAPDWNGESFRVYSRRTSDQDYFLIAEVTNCAGGLCSYTDVNVQPGQTYDYYVAAVDPDTGVEAATESSVEVDVPQPTPPPVPQGVTAVALDGAVYVTWTSKARSASDFSAYRVYLVDGGQTYFLGETDSEGFLDALAVNGTTSTYEVSSVDDQGHESDVSIPASGTPRPDYHSEWLWSYADQPASSGFRFPVDEQTNPVVDGDSPSRQFRLETDADGWWLVPGPGTSVQPQGWATTALKCGVGADADCSSLDVAPTSGYVQQDVGLDPQTTYVLRVTGDDGQLHYAAVRVDLLGSDQSGYAIMIFDWAYQLQPGNPQLAPRPARTR